MLIVCKPSTHQYRNRVHRDALMQLQHGLLEGAHIGSVLMQILRELNREKSGVLSLLVFYLINKSTWEE